MSSTPSAGQGCGAASTFPGIGRIAPDLYGRQNRPVRAVVQRVSEARIRVGGNLVSGVGPGLVVLLGVAQDDSVETAERLARKVARLRVFANEEDRFDRSLIETGAEVLVVSQFTLVADSRRQRGTRPDFSKAAKPDVAEPLYERFCEALREFGVPVQTGVFGARMQLSLVNDGPVTIVLDV